MKVKYIHKNNLKRANVRNPDATAVMFNIELMQNITKVFWAGLLLLLIYTLLRWVLSSSIFSIQKITLYGQTSHLSENQIRQHILPQIQGNFFTINPRQIQMVFENLPWIKTASISKRYPNQLLVHVVEHTPLAHWDSGDGMLKMIDKDAIIFEVLEMNDQFLQIKAPEHNAQNVLIVLDKLQTLLPPLFKQSIQSLELTDSGYWRVLLTHDIVIEMGRGSVTEILHRIEIFVKTILPIAEQLKLPVSDLLSVDLRHGEGYAVRFSSINTKAQKTSQEQEKTASSINNMKPHPSKIH